MVAEEKAVPCFSFQRKLPSVKFFAEFGKGKGTFPPGVFRLVADGSVVKLKAHTQDRHLSPGILDGCFRRHIIRFTDRDKVIVAEDFVIQFPEITVVCRRIVAPRP